MRNANLELEHIFTTVSASSSGEKFQATILKPLDI